MTLLTCLNFTFLKKELEVPTLQMEFIPPSLGIQTETAIPWKKERITQQLNLENSNSIEFPKTVFIVSLPPKLIRLIRITILRTGLPILLLKKQLSRLSF